MSDARIADHAKPESADEPDSRKERSRLLARRARLRYVCDQDPGIGRAHRGKGFIYKFMPEGRSIPVEQKTRIVSLAIPPAWQNVWICRLANGHLQATGRDDRARKQYLYHERWTEIVARAKYDRLAEIGRLLPRIRRQALADVARFQPTQQAVVALVVRLIDLTGIRVGNSEYLRDNESYGMTTLLKRQAHISGSKIVFSFRGKSGVDQQVEIDDADIAKCLKSLQSLRGKFLFQFRNDSGIHVVTSADVNAYLAQLTADRVTAKDFRTWRASCHIARLLAGTNPEIAQPRQLKRRLMQALRSTASILGNTVTVCRKYYVHTALTDSFLAGELVDVAARFQPKRRRWHSSDEQRLLYILDALTE